MKNQYDHFVTDRKYGQDTERWKQINKITSEYGGIRALPTSIIIDRNGEIKRIYPTAILKQYTPDIYSSFIYDVETALNKKNEKE